MKLTKTILGLVLVSLIFTKSVNALVPVKINVNNLKLAPTVIPTLVPTIAPIKLDTSKFKLVPTIKPTATPTKAVVATVTEKPIPTITTSPTEKVEPSVTIVPANSSLSDDLSKWFLVATVALLTLIIVVQAWPDKNNKEE